MTNIDWYKIVDTIQRYKIALRIKWAGDCDEPEWAPWVIIPTDGYIETGGMGPIPFRDVEWIEIDTSRFNKNGRLIPNSDAAATTNQMRLDCELFVFYGTLARIHNT
jgi:hypothetical protein